MPSVQLRRGGGYSGMVFFYSTFMSSEELMENYGLGGYFVAVLSAGIELRG